jgi:hypothetical protein
MSNKLFLLTKVLFICIFSGCEFENKSKNSGNYSVSELQIDTLKIDFPKSSQIGFFQLIDDSIFYIDSYYGTIYGIDPENKNVSKKLTIMEGPENLMGIHELIGFSDGYIIRHDLHFYFYTKDWEFKRKFYLNTADGIPFNTMADKPLPHYTSMYEIQNYNPKTSVLPNGNLLVKIDVEHPKFNAFSTREFYKSAALLGEIDFQNGKIVSLLGNRPNSYDKFTFVPLHSFFDYAVHSGRLFFTFEVDSLIYEHALDFTLKNKFGAKGNPINQNYEQTKMVDIAYDNDKFRSSRRNNGYYHNLYVTEKSDYVFRTYRTGTSQNVSNENDNPLRLQVYKERDLIMDSEVPGRFKIIGQIGNKFYADGFFDEINEEQGIYVFNIH